MILTSDIGTYLGTYQLIGGEDGGTFTGVDNLAQAPFSVTVATPEPGTFVMVCAVLAALVWRRRTAHRWGSTGN